MPAPEFNIMASRFDVSLLPEDDANHHSFLITIEYRGRGNWAIKHGAFMLNRQGGWTWNGKVRFTDLAECFVRAQQAYLRLRVNGWSWDGVRDPH